MLSSENPLWIPRGSIRALITFSILATAVYLLVVSGGAEKSVPEWWVALVVFVVKDYFSTRESERAREEMDKVLRGMQAERSHDRILDSHERTTT
jgi:hypothetical protein